MSRRRRKILLEHPKDIGFLINLEGEISKILLEGAEGDITQEGAPEDSE